MYGSFTRYKKRRLNSSQTKYRRRHYRTFFRGKIKRSSLESYSTRTYPSRVYSRPTYRRPYQAYKPWTRYHQYGKQIGQFGRYYIANKLYPNRYRSLPKPYHIAGKTGKYYLGESSKLKPYSEFFQQQQQYNDRQRLKRKAFGVISDIAAGEISDYLRRTPEESDRVSKQSWTDWGKEKFNHLVDSAVTAGTYLGTASALGYGTALLNE